MKLETRNTDGLDWPSHALFALDGDNAQKTPPGWSAFSNGHDLTATAVERYGQITPPEANLHTDLCRDTARAAPIPVEQLQNKALWLLEYYQPPLSDSEEKPQPQEQSVRTSKRQRTTKQKAANRKTAVPKLKPQADSAVNPPPQKRKCGRPKSQPHIVEAFTSDNSPVKCTSARQLHLEKNRLAAQKCRQRKKKYINNLEARFYVDSAKNKALKENVAVLREEVLELKNEVLRHAECGFWAVDKYLARSASNLLGISAPLGISASQKRSRSGSPDWCTPTLSYTEREPSTTESPPSQGISDAFSPNDFECLVLLENIDGEDGEQIV